MSCMTAGQGCPESGSANTSPSSAAGPAGPSGLRPTHSTSGPLRPRPADPGLLGFPHWAPGDPHLLVLPAAPPGRLSAPAGAGLTSRQPSPGTCCSGGTQEWGAWAEGVQGSAGGGAAGVDQQGSRMAWGGIPRSLAGRLMALGVRFGCPLLLVALETQLVLRGLSFPNPHPGPPEVGCSFLARSTRQASCLASRMCQSSPVAPAGLSAIPYP